MPEQYLIKISYVISWGVGALTMKLENIMYTVRVNFSF